MNGCSLWKMLEATLQKSTTAGAIQPKERKGKIVGLRREYIPGKIGEIWRTACHWLWLCSIWGSQELGSQVYGSQKGSRQNEPRGQIWSGPQGSSCSWRRRPQGKDPDSLSLPELTDRSVQDQYADSRRGGGLPTSYAKLWWFILIRSVAIIL